MRISGELHEARMDLLRQRDQAAERARAAAESARDRVGPLDRLAGAIGARTKAVQEADAAETRAEQAEAARHDGRELRADLAGCDWRAAMTVREREACASPGGGAQR